jgi:hypothetical protein
LPVVCVVCCLCDGLITRPDESYRLWRVVCDHETSWYEEAIAALGCSARETNNIMFTVMLKYD